MQIRAFFRSTARSVVAELRPPRALPGAAAAADRGRMAEAPCNAPGGGWGILIPTQ